MAAAGDKQLTTLSNWILRNNPLLEPWDEADVSPRLFGLAKPYYQAIWHSCSSEEQLALYHLAKDGFLHAHHPEFPRLFVQELIR